ncbi:hypothetical protein FOL47_010938 [Perkinsus chesapeaki]|uniref:RRM domain-containing protein n=1 Tax=Perkinsus chesapeaki TaxID=330153 RepID=A0A7J6N291_PERCH|nr:hypothetical protein FOL47_010938 [Perkinsus chesapeaki]
MPPKWRTSLPPERRDAEWCPGKTNARTHCRIAKCNGGKSYFVFFQPPESTQFDCVYGPLRSSFDRAAEDIPRLTAAKGDRELGGVVMKMLMQEGAIVHRKASLGKGQRPGVMLKSPYIKVKVPAREGHGLAARVALRGIRFNTVECELPVSEEVKARLNHTKMRRVIDCVVELLAKCVDEDLQRPCDHDIYRCVRDTLGSRLPLLEGEILRLIDAVSEHFPCAGVAGDAAPVWLDAFRGKSRVVDTHVAEVVKDCEAERRHREDVGKARGSGEEEEPPRKRQKHTPADRTVFVSNIDRTTGLGELRDAVNEWMGEKAVDRCAIPVERQTGAVRGHAFLYFKTAQGAERFIEKCAGEEFVVKGRALRTAKVLEENLQGEELQAKLADQKKDMFRLPPETEEAIRSVVAGDDGCNISLVKHKVESDLGPVNLAKYGFKSWSKAMKSVPGISVDAVRNEEKEGKMSGYVARLSKA